MVRSRRRPRDYDLYFVSRAPPTETSSPVDTHIIAESYRQLHKDVEENPGLAVERLLAGVMDTKDMNAVDKWGRTPLEIALDKGLPDVIALLVQSGAKMPAHLANELNHGRGLDNGGRSALHSATDRGLHSAVRTLIEAHVDPSYPDQNLITPLHLAAAGGSILIVSCLLGAAAKIDALDVNGQSPLTWGIERDTDIATCLLQAMGSVDLVDADGCTALRRAIAGHHVSMCCCLITARASTNCSDSRDQTPLHMAAAQGLVDVTDALLRARASIDAKDDRKWTPLHSASHAGQEQVVRQLLALHASISNGIPFDLDSLRARGLTTVASLLEPSHVVIATRLELMSALRSLLSNPERRVNLDLRSNDVEHLPLMLATCEGQIVELLLPPSEQFKIPPPRIVSKGKAAIFKYFRDKEAVVANDTVVKERCVTTASTPQRSEHRFTDLEFAQEQLFPEEKWFRAKTAAASKERGPQVGIAATTLRSVRKAGGGVLSPQDKHADEFDFAEDDQAPLEPEADPVLEREQLFPDEKWFRAKNKAASKETGPQIGRAAASVRSVRHVAESWQNMRNNHTDPDGHEMRMF